MVEELPVGDASFYFTVQTFAIKGTLRLQAASARFLVVTGRLPLIRSTHKTHRLKACKVQPATCVLRGFWQGDAFLKSAFCW